MASRVASVLLVFGRGLVMDEQGNATLTAASVARVRVAGDYVLAHQTHYAGRIVRIVFTGGWPGASAGIAAPPAGCREADLMLHQAICRGLSRVAELHAESESRSTLENVIFASELLGDQAFSEQEPLGLVTHAAHLVRIRYLIRKVLGLRRTQVLPILARGDDSAGRPSERVVSLAFRMAFLGARDPEILLRREGCLVAMARRLRIGSDEAGRRRKGFR